MDKADGVLRSAAATAAAESTLVGGEGLKRP